ncbi:biotin--[acetyl-CoA-carboxylase] ligase [Undibacterium sp. TS12]|uniref:biotin--[acetyl-CoA-carboxylase] ligase n=1 Tax=Undibacterium sp. TS12 TaxID=2908202 RepID=UPI001F4CDFAF|nr:biotin--[acetyl-CoA-carboxylase] ligase [Undibacterium sp. TS12]MCH8617789.1 biotin--[acetyl-CoA-carboxylase] ligase [Undibacterium sp. TS12]
MQLNKNLELNASAIERLCDAAARDVDIEVVAETGSTNADLMTRLLHLSCPVMRVAVNQTAGRGRAGRPWLTVPGGMLTFSLAWHLPQAPHNLLGLPLAVGVALAECLNVLNQNVTLKWPNDVLREGKKLAGILVESAAAGNGGTWVVVGIGLNLQVSDELEVQVGRSLADAPWLAQMDRNVLLAQILNALVQALTQFGEQGFAPLLPRWNALHAYAGQTVNILDRDQIVHTGIALGVDLHGCLVLQTEQGQVSVLAGDVSLRPA